MHRLMVAMVALGAVALIAGCKSDPCEQLYDKVAECSPEFTKAVSKADYVKACKAKPADDPAQACLSRGTCEHFSACVNAAAQAAAAEKQLAAIKALVEAKDWKKASSACNTAGKNTKALGGYTETCTPVWTQQYDEAYAMHVAERDKGGKAKCRGITRLAKLVGGDAPAKAATLCTELAVSGTVTKLIADGKAARTKGTRTDFVAQCTAALTTLEGLGSDWAKARAKALASACFLEARGLMVVGIMSGSKPSCSPDLKAVVAGLVKYELSSPEVEPHLPAAKTLCGIK